MNPIVSDTNRIRMSWFLAVVFGILGAGLGGVLLPIVFAQESAVSAIVLCSLWFLSFSLTFVFHPDDSERQPGSHSLVAIDTTNLLGVLLVLGSGSLCYLVLCRLSMQTLMELLRSPYALASVSVIMISWHSRAALRAIKMYNMEAKRVSVPTESALESPIPARHLKVKVIAAALITSATLIAVRLLWPVPNMEMLAEEVLKNTPEHIHFAPGANFSWCLFGGIEGDPLPDLKGEVLRKLRLRYTVYLAKDDVPPHYKQFHDGRLAGYHRGFSFNVRVETINRSTIRIGFADWEGSLAASSHWKVYKWTGSRWRILETSRILVS